MLMNHRAVLVVLRFLFSVRRSDIGDARSLLIAQSSAPFVLARGS
jgi:hypothetical protein